MGGCGVGRVDGGMTAPVIVRPNTLACCLNGNLSEVELALDFVKVRRNTWNVSWET